MKKKTLFACLALVSVALFAAPAGLSVTCDDGTSQSGNCAVGRVTLSSSAYNGTVHVNVVNDSTGTVYDDFDYDASGGHITFTQSLIPAGSYTVTLVSNGTSYTQTITAGN